MKFYASLETFYSENEARRQSPEADYGVWWMDDSKYEHWRVSYVQATGEVYAVKLPGVGEVRVLGIVPPDPDERTRADLRRQLTYYRTLDRILAGWVNHCGQPGGLAWIRERLAQATMLEADAARMDPTAWVAGDAERLSQAETAQEAAFGEGGVHGNQTS